MDVFIERVDTEKRRQRVMSYDYEIREIKSQGELEGEKEEYDD